MQKKHVLMDGYTLCENVLSLYEYFSKNERSRCTSAEGQRKEFIAVAGWLTTLIFKTLNYTHVHTNILAIDFTCLREMKSMVPGGVLIIYSSGYTHYQEPKYV
jgi:hypothetical protein